jgi:hypothetical protein
MHHHISVDRQPPLHIRMECHVHGECTVSSKEHAHFAELTAAGDNRRIIGQVDNVQTIAIALSVAALCRQ